MQADGGLWQCHDKVSGANYQEVNHGDRREEIFRDDSDRERFVATLSETRADLQRIAISG